MHRFYLDEEDKSISFDLIIDSKAKNREQVYTQLYDEIKNKYKTIPLA